MWKNIRLNLNQPNITKFYYMKTYLLTALFLGATVISCSKQKTEENTTNDTMSTADMSADTSMALPPTDTAAMNAPAPGRTDSANTMRDSAATSTRR